LNSGVATLNHFEQTAPKDHLCISCKSELFCEQAEDLERGLRNSLLSMH